MGYLLGVRYRPMRHILTMITRGVIAEGAPYCVAGHYECCKAASTANWVNLMSQGVIILNLNYVLVSLRVRNGILRWQSMPDSTLPRSVLWQGDAVAMSVGLNQERAGTDPGSEILATCSAIGSVDRGCVSAE